MSSVNGNQPKFIKKQFEKWLRNFAQSFKWKLWV